MKAFKSTHTDVIAWVENSRVLDAQFNEQVKALLADYPGTTTVRMLRFMNGYQVLGVVATQSPGEGWREHGKHENTWVADKRYKAGVEHDRRLQELKTAPGPVPGMPVIAFSGMKQYFPGFDLINGVLYVTWAFDELPQDDFEIDPSIWVPCSLSEYYSVKGQ